jgi:hypothetical protein
MIRGIKMTCQDSSYQSCCHIFKVYISSGSQGYHGELCNDCPHWLDSCEDKKFKEKQAKFYEDVRIGRKVNKLSDLSVIYTNSKNNIDTLIGLLACLPTARSLNTLT